MHYDNYIFQYNYFLTSKNPLMTGGIRMQKLWMYSYMIHATCKYHGREIYVNQVLTLEGVTKFFAAWTVEVTLVPENQNMRYSIEAPSIKQLAELYLSHLFYSSVKFA